MKVNPLPPQAYTKETLQKAYTWLLNQGPNVKEMATTQDMLISLYLKAQRNGEASLEAPSIQNFKQELKSLASMIGNLQTPNAHVTAQGAELPLSPNSQNAKPEGVSANLGQLDLQSLQILAEVKQTLNLSSDLESLRALISLGYKQIKKLNI